MHFEIVRLLFQNALHCMLGAIGFLWLHFCFRLQLFRFWKQNPARQGAPKDHSRMKNASRILYGKKPPDRAIERTNGLQDRPNGAQCPKKLPKCIRIIYKNKHIVSKIMIARIASALILQTQFADSSLEQRPQFGASCTAKFQTKRASRLHVHASKPHSLQLENSANHCTL